MNRRGIFFKWCLGMKLWCQPKYWKFPKICPSAFLCSSLILRGCWLIVSPNLSCVHSLLWHLFILWAVGSFFIFRSVDGRIFQTSCTPWNWINCSPNPSSIIHVPKFPTSLLVPISSYHKPPHLKPLKPPSLNTTSPVKIVSPMKTFVNEIITIEISAHHCAEVISSRVIN